MIAPFILYNLEAWKYIINMAILLEITPNYLIMNPLGNGVSLRVKREKPL